MADDQFTIRVDDDRSWSTNSEFAEYDATHAVVGALLAGADRVVIERDGGDEETIEDEIDALGEDGETIAEHIVETHTKIDDRPSALRSDDDE